jgi:hypothetical protein
MLRPGRAGAVTPVGTGVSIAEVAAIVGLSSFGVLSCVAIESSYRLNLRATRSLAIDHVSQAAERAVKADGRHEWITSAEFDVDRFPEIIRVVEEEIRTIRIDRVYTDEPEPL